MLYTANVGKRIRGMRFLIYLMVIAVGLFMVGCGAAAPSDSASGDESPPAQQDTPPAQETPAQEELEPIDLVFMTGSTGGTFQAMGAALAEAIQKELPHITVSVQPGGSGNNIMGIEQGQAQLGISNSFVTSDALKGNEPFESEATKTYNLASLHPQYFQLFVEANSDIQSIGDLRGKSIVTLRQGSAGETGVSDVLEVYGLTYDDLSKAEFGSAGPNIDLMKDGHVDAISWVAPMPASYFIDLTTSKDMRLVPPGEAELQELNSVNPGYVPDVIPAGTYKGIDEEVPTFSTYAHLIISGDLDEDLIYDLTKVIVENSTVLSSISKDLSSISPETMVREIGVPFHPASERYFKESGLK